MVSAPLKLQISAAKPTSATTAYTLPDRSGLPRVKPKNELALKACRVKAVTSTPCQFSRGIKATVKAATSAYSTTNATGPYRHSPRPTLTSRPKPSTGRSGRCTITSSSQCEIDESTNTTPATHPNAAAIAAPGKQAMALPSTSECEYG